MCTRKNRRIEGPGPFHEKIEGSKDPAPFIIDSPFFESNVSREILKKNIENQIREILNQTLKTEDFKVLKNHKVELMFL